MATEPLIRIVDDNESLRSSLAFMLSCEGWSVVTYETAREFLAKDRPSIPGCVVLDVKMPGMTGLELQEELNRRNFKLPIIFLTGHGDIDMAVQTMRDGAFDFQQKPVIPEKFLPSIARAVEKDRQRRGEATDLKGEIELYRKLTEREAQICRLVAKGLVNRVIAERLGISKRTVDHLRSSALQKIGQMSAAEMSGFFARVDKALARK